MRFQNISNTPPIAANTDARGIKTSGPRYSINMDGPIEFQGVRVA